MKNITIISLCIVLLCAFVAPSSDYKGVQFQNINFNQALAKAKQENKFVFMNVYAVWCGPCKLLKKNTFTSDKVGAAVNKSFVSIDVDAEKGEGISLSKKYEVKAHPLILIINPEGKVVKRILGYRTDAQLLSELKGLLK